MNEYFSSRCMGISNDFESLCTKYAQMNSISYEDFLKLWIEMHFDCLFAGRINDRECREFTEECMKLVSIFSYPVYQFNVRVCSIYLFYALYHTHPFQPKVKVRLTMQEWDDTLTFIEEIKQKADQLSLVHEEKNAIMVDINNDVVSIGDHGNNVTNVHNTKFEINDIIGSIVESNVVVDNKNDDDDGYSDVKNDDLNDLISSIVKNYKKEDVNVNTNGNDINNYINGSNNDNNNNNNNSNNNVNNYSDNVININLDNDIKNINDSNVNDIIRSNIVDANSHNDNINNNNINQINSADSQQINPYNDVLYAFNSLRKEKAFQFVANKTQLHPAMKLSSEVFGDVEQQKIDFLIKRQSAVSRIFNSDAIDEMSAISEEYSRHKQLVFDTIFDDPSLKVVDNSIIQYITRVVTSHEDWKKNKATRKIRKRLDSGSHATSDSEIDSEVDQLSRSSTPVREVNKSQGNVRSEIKLRAFASTEGVNKYNEQRSFRNRSVNLNSSNTNDIDNDDDDDDIDDGDDDANNQKIDKKSKVGKKLNKINQESNNKTKNKTKTKNKKKTKEKKKRRPRNFFSISNDGSYVNDDGNDDNDGTLIVDEKDEATASQKKPPTKRKRSHNDSFEVAAPKNSKRKLSSRVTTKTLNSKTLNTKVVSDDGINIGGDHDDDDDNDIMVREETLMTKY